MTSPASIPGASSLSPVKVYRFPSLAPLSKSTFKTVFSCFIFWPSQSLHLSSSLINTPCPV